MILDENKKYGFGFDSIKQKHTLFEYELVKELTIKDNKEIEYVQFEDTRFTFIGFFEEEFVLEHFNIKRYEFLNDTTEDFVMLIDVLDVEVIKIEDTFYNIDVIVDENFEMLIWFIDNNKMDKGACYARTIPKVIEFYEKIEKSRIEEQNKKFDFFLEFLSVGFIEIGVEKDFDLVDNNLAYLTLEVEEHKFVTFYLDKGFGSFIDEDTGNVIAVPIINGNFQSVFRKFVRIEYEMYGEPQEISDFKMHVRITDIFLV